MVQITEYGPGAPASLASQGSALSTPEQQELQTLRIRQAVADEMARAAPGQRQEAFSMQTCGAPAPAATSLAASTDPITVKIPAVSTWEKTLQSNSGMLLLLSLVSTWLVGLYMAVKVSTLQDQHQRIFRYLGAVVDHLQVKVPMDA